VVGTRKYKVYGEIKRECKKGQAAGPKPHVTKTTKAGVPGKSLTTVRANLAGKTQLEMYPWANLGKEGSGNC